MFGYNTNYGLSLLPTVGATGVIMKGKIGYVKLPYIIGKEFFTLFFFVLLKKNF